MSLSLSLSCDQFRRETSNSSVDNLESRETSLVAKLQDFIDVNDFERE